MKCAPVLIVVALLAGCDPVPELSIRADEWVCSKTARMESVTPLIAGKAVIPQTHSRLECVQWTRMGEQP
ncbi:hypothetical protein OMD46_16450 [Pseudomonas sp. MDMC_285]|nr:hypothetical protein [Pseudomonas sp. MDMC_285]